MNINDVALGAEKFGAVKAGASGDEPASSIVGSEDLLERDRGCFGAELVEVVTGASTAGTSVFLAAVRRAGVFFTAAESTAAFGELDFGSVAALAATFAGLATAEEAFLAAGLRVVLGATTSSEDALTGTFESFLFTISGVLQAAFG
jgi:hypothetical protein